MLRTFRTDVPGGRAAIALDAWGALSGRVERRLHARLQAGDAWKDLATTWYKEPEAEGLSAKRLEHIARALIGKRDAACEAAKENVSTLKIKVSAKDKDVRKKETALAKVRAAIQKALKKRANAAALIKKETRRLAEAKKDGVRA